MRVLKPARRATSEELRGLRIKLSNPEVIEMSEKRSKQFEECVSKEHPNSRILMQDSTKVYLHCNDCGMPYNRTPSFSESKSFYNLMNAPFTI